MVVKSRGNEIVRMVGGITVGFADREATRAVGADATEKRKKSGGRRRGRELGWRRKKKERTERKRKTKVRGERRKKRKMK